MSSFDNLAQGFVVKSLVESPFGKVAFSKFPKFSLFTKCSDGNRKSSLVPRHKIRELEILKKSWLGLMIFFKIHTGNELLEAAVRC